jgi:hypothetical protein
MTRNFLLIITLLFLPTYVSASIENYRGTIADAAKTYGINPSILAAIVIIESNGRPWTFNIDGEGMHFPSRNKAIEKFNHIIKNRWLVKFRTAENRISRVYFPTRSKALNWINRSNSLGTASYSLIEKKLIPVERGQIVLRKLNLINTDIGLSQINYRWHGEKYKERFGFYQWLNPDLNLYYAAKHIKELYTRHGDMYKAVAYYHSSTKNNQKKYLKKFIKAYKKEVDKTRV